MAMRARKEMPAPEPPKEETPAAEPALKSVPTEAAPEQDYLPGVHKYRKPRGMKEAGAKKARKEAMAARVDEAMAQEDEREAAAGILAEKYGADKAKYEQGLEADKAAKSKMAADVAIAKEIEALDLERRPLQKEFDKAIGTAEEKGDKWGEHIRAQTLKAPRTTKLRELSARRAELIEAIGGEERLAELLAQHEANLDKADLEQMLAEQRTTGAKKDREQMEQARIVIAQEGGTPPETEVARRAYDLKVSGQLRKDFDIKTLEELERQRKNLEAEHARLGASRWSKLWNGGKIDDLEYQLAVLDGELKPYEDEVRKLNQDMIRDRESGRQSAAQTTGRIEGQTKALAQADALRAEGHTFKSRQGEAAMRMMDEGALHPSFDLVTYDRMEAEIDRLQTEESGLATGFWSRLKNAGRLSQIRRKIQDFNEKLSPMRADMAANVVEQVRGAELDRRTLDEAFPKTPKTQGQIEEDFFRRGKATGGKDLSEADRKSDIESAL